MYKRKYTKIIQLLTNNYSIRNLEEIAKRKNILVIYSDLNNGGGLYRFIDRTKVIIINSKLSYYHQLIILAHEIAHAILHPYEQSAFTFIGIPKTNRKENEANYFACELLEIIGFWENDNLCIYESELSKGDLKFIESYRKYYLKENYYVNQ